MSALSPRSAFSVYIPEFPSQGREQTVSLLSYLLSAYSPGTVFWSRSFFLSLYLNVAFCCPEHLATDRLKTCGRKKKWYKQQLRNGLAFIKHYEQLKIKSQVHLHCSHDFCLFKEGCVMGKELSLGEDLESSMSRKELQNVGYYLFQNA